MGRGWAATRRREHAVQMLILCLALVTFLAPLGWTAFASLGVVPRGTYPVSVTWPPSLDHFGDVGVAEPSFWQELVTSVGVSIVATVLAVTVALMGAYGLARSRFRARGYVVQSLLVLASLPVVAYAIPLSEVMRHIALSDTYPGLVLGASAVTAPLATYVLYGQLSQLSADSEQAASLDGAGLARLLWAVVVPQIAPALAATAIIVFVLDWNLLLIPLVLAGVEVKTLPIAMVDFFTFERELEWPTAAAALIISLVPLSILVALGYRLLDQFTLGATRGVAE